MNKKLYLFCIAFISGLSSPALAQSPGGVSAQNTVWLKANTGVTLNASNQVDSWAEQSGAGITGDFSTHNPGTGGTTQVPPTVLDNGINFNPYLVFVSTNPNCISSDNLVAGTDIFSNSEMTMFQIINLHTTVGTGVWCKWQTSNTASGRLGDEVNNGGGNQGKIRLDFKSTIYSNTVVTDLHSLYTGYSDASTLGIRLNGATDNTMTTFGTVNPFGTARLSLGNENETGGDPYPTTVDMAEFILYSRALTPAEINKVESYLGVKYGFTLIQTGAEANNYTASDNTIIWDNVANAPYYNNITGIGRDDASGLDQRQSLSINDDALVTIYNGTYSGGFPAVNAANTNSFNTDLSLLLFGDNMGDTALTACANGGAIAIMNRVWKVQQTGTMGAVTLSVKNNMVPAGVQTLVIADDPAFSTNVSTVTLTDNGTDLFASATLNNGQYFTFGAAPLTLTSDVTQALCSGQNGAIALTPSGGLAPISYDWNTTPPQTTATASNLSEGTYTVTVTQGNGCSIQQSFVIDAAATPINTSVTDLKNAYCTATNGSATVLADGGTPPYSYAVDGSTDWVFSNILQGLNAGEHTVTIQDANGCLAYDTFNIGSDFYELTLQVDTLINALCDRGGLGGYITVSVVPGTGTAPFSYQWNNSFTEISNTIEDVPAGTYSVIVTDANGCTGDTTVQVTEMPCCSMMMPQVFSPNGDGKNDLFLPLFSNPIANYTFSIFNRWGQRVFIGNKGDMGWDGTFNGKPADVGVYYYTLTYICERGNQEYHYQGDVTLVR